ncbi:hypothetical protein PFLUV_G00071960 [Perca fluviatilis]|uniref:Selenoprotein P N-terminal domain-containing protein n=1 Tax=Perca fluviatilis TaxID=8168 RepID=A0A6A5F3S9_PERFL|nr:hypothetical protein PFLUV_G00071960 [Perca fluviatilis]
MWACLSLLITLCLLHGGGAESDGGGPRCQLPPAWKIGEASRMDDLRQKLEGQGLKDVVYMVVNQQAEQARRLHTMLAQRLSENITLYKQDEQQPDVWKTLSGQKDDFLIYDRCGRLTHHISLPYSIIGHGHVEGAIKDTYCKRICGDCTHESTETPEGCTEKADAQPDADPTPAGVSNWSDCDTVMRRCPPPDFDTGREAIQPLMLWRPDSDARLLLPDSSLSQPNEPDPKV